MIGLGFLAAVFLGVPAIVYALDRRRRARTDEERDDDALWAAQHHEGPGTHDPLSGPPIQPPSS
jgi:cbb3-type cytochrome oxidase subunit 3